MLYSICRAKRNDGGDYAEVGVFRGASASVIAEAKSPETSLFLFDTFDGLPAVGALDARFKEGMYRWDETLVRARLSAYSNVHIIKGVFPETAGVVNRRLFSLVHLDVDTYESTSSSLSFFADRMLPGGVILSHDFSQCPGVNRALLDFASRAPDYLLIELPISQAMLVKKWGAFGL